MPTSLPIPQIKLGKRKERSQMCEVLTDDGRWIDVEMPVAESCVVDDKAKMAFLLSDFNQFQDAKDETTRQILTEKSRRPVCLREPDKLNDGVNDEQDRRDLSDDLFKTSSKRVRAETYEKINEADRMERAIFLVAIASSASLIIVALTQMMG